MVRGDLLREPVEAIVNAANGHLAHGGGVAGLATAYRLLRAGADPIVLEAADAAGGVIAPPLEVGDLALEPGPDARRKTNSSSSSGMTVTPAPAARP